jgi:hypothetical protein
VSKVWRNPCQYGPRTQALAAQREAGGLSFRVAYGLPDAAIDEWGIYTAVPEEDITEKAPYSAPALFLLDGDGRIKLVGGPTDGQTDRQAGQAMQAGRRART